MKKIISIILVTATLVSIYALPIDTSAKTVAQFEAEVKKYTKDLEATNASLAKNDAEVKAIQQKIATYEKQIKEAENTIVTLQKEIDESNLEIEKKSEESKKIIEYYQVANGTNAYLEYAFGADSITDMIYRMSVVEQLTEYNDKIMRELEALIAKNKKQQEELTAKKQSLVTLSEQAEKEKKKIQADIASLRDTVPSIKTRIAEAQEMVKYYKSLGCGANEDVQACQHRIEQSSSSSLPSVGFFSRPMQNGYVVRGFSSGHIGYDLSSGNKTEPIYPIAAGSIHAIYTDECTSGRWCQNMGISCKGNAKIVVVKHNYNGSYIYSSYVHLSNYGSIYQGQFVTKDTVIGYMGNTGCSTGPHLHLEIARCFWKNNGGCVYDSYVNRLINPRDIISFPSQWNNR